jgi:hypothetical protein
MTPKNDFEREVISFMSRIDEHMENQNKRCDSHAARFVVHEKRMKDTEDRASSLEASRNFALGVLKALGIGIPTLASVFWGALEIWKVIKG